MLEQIKGYACQCNKCGARGPVVEWRRDMQDVPIHERCRAELPEGWQRLGNQDFCPSHKLVL